MNPSDFTFNQLEEYLVEAKSNVPLDIKDKIFIPIKKQSQIDVEALESLKQTVLELFYEYHEKIMPHVRFIDGHNAVGFEVSLLETECGQTSFVNLGGEGNSHRIVAFLIPMSDDQDVLRFPSQELNIQLRSDSIYIIPSNMSYRFYPISANSMSAMCFFITVPHT